MAAYYICEIDKKINTKLTDAPSALRRVERFIINKIDPNFPVQEFREWVNSSSESPFKVNKNRYFWE